MADLGWMKEWILPLATTLFGGGFVKWLEIRGKARETIEASSTKRAELSIEQEKIREEADDRLIEALMEERKTDRASHQAELNTLRAEFNQERVVLRAEVKAERESCQEQLNKQAALIEKLQERVTAFIQTNAEYQSQILLLTRQVANLEARLEKGNVG